MLVWRWTLYQKREVIALFVCKLPKIKVFNKKIGSKFDTTQTKQEEMKMKKYNLSQIMTAAWNYVKYLKVFLSLGLKKA